MQYHQRLVEANPAVFHAAPQEFTRDTPRESLAHALGATLYMPATRATLASDVQRQAGLGALSVVVCLEDAVPDSRLSAAEENLVDQLAVLSDPGRELPLLFLRPRSADHLVHVMSLLGATATALTGFALPKFSPRTGPAYLSAAQTASQMCGQHFFVMPILEDPAVLVLESRAETLTALADLLGNWRADVLAVRLGAADLSSVHGLRRPAGMSIYDINVLAGAISDVVNVLGRADGTGFTITGPVWEHWATAEARAGLVREVQLDLANGLEGKTVVHPSQVPVVNALLTVGHEDFMDASVIAGDLEGGATASQYRNKMNEAKPHQAWAVRILQRAALFGVLREGVSWSDLPAGVDKVRAS